MFHFKTFSIKQTDNLQKVGSDSVLLGAYVKGHFNRILDIGTGTGLLALMQAQQQPQAKIIGIEPHLASYHEAKLNVNASIYKEQIDIIHSDLQTFTNQQPFDLIISNPPYFENDYLSPKEERNQARHTNSLPIETLYKQSAELLYKNGILFIIYPESVHQKHLNSARNFDLHPQSILEIKTDKGTIKRYITEFSFETKNKIKTESLIIKHSNNTYSQKYIELTKAFYQKDLSIQ